MTSSSEIKLNAREKMLLEAIRLNLDFEQIARKIRLSVRTLKQYYLKTLMLKLKCESIEQLRVKI